MSIPVAYNIGMTPTARSLEYARKRGWAASVCERYCSYTRRRFDLFGVFDLVVLDDLWGCIGVQTTSGPNVSARIHKMESSSDCSRWLASGLRAEVWGWRKVAAYRKDGARAKVDRWDIRIVRLEAPLSARAVPQDRCLTTDRGLTTLAPLASLTDCVP